MQTQFLSHSTNYIVYLFWWHHHHPKCDLTQMTLMQVLHTGSYLHRRGPLCKLSILRAVIWYTVYTRIFGGNLDFSVGEDLGIWAFVYQ